MEIINTVIGTPLGYLMRFLYNLFGGNYGIAIIVFTLCTKIIMFPISMLVQKNSIKMVKMKPELDSLRFQYVDDKDASIDAQTALYKREHYSPMAGVWPLLLQLPIIFGLLDVVYKPLKHLLHISSGVATSMVARAAQLLNMSVDDLGSTAQLKVVQLIQGGRGAEFADIAGAPDAHRQDKHAEYDISRSKPLRVANARRYQCLLLNRGALRSFRAADVHYSEQDKRPPDRAEQALSVGNDRIHGRFLSHFLRLSYPQESVCTGCGVTSLQSL